MPKITYTDEVDARFGIPWTDDLKYDKGELVCALSEEEVDRLTIEDPERAETLTRLLMDQPASEKEDPIQWGWTLPGWRRVMERFDKDKIHVIMGGNRSSKSILSTRMLVHLAQIIPEAEIRSMHVTEERSIQDSQKMVWAALPMRYKRSKKKGANHSLQYNQKNGFNSAKAILPPTDPSAERGSTIYFNNYRQYMADPQIFEGWSAHCIHLEEEVPNNIYETLLGRTVDYHGRLILSFTTLQGFTPLVDSLLKGAETVRTRYSELLQRELPVEQISANWPDCRIHFLWTQDNPFIDGQELVRTYSKQPLETKLARLYGIPSKSFEGRFPKFNREVNVIEHEKVPFIADPSINVTRYMICDPGGSKPWAAVWIGVTSDGLAYVYREFPDQSMNGPWALPHVNNAGKSVGKPGPGQKPLGWGYSQYYDHFMDLENGEDVFERIVDPRMGSATVREKEGESNIINTMSNLGMVFRPAPGVDVESGIAKINDALAWDDTEPMTEQNRPKLFVSERCENVISSLMEYSGQSRQEHWKDFVDTIRYFYVSGPEHVSQAKLAVTGGGSY
tara:strand:+ start:529 stop:2217 length:1689 start_codon:yes stop_codon:yes gene_type:complete